MQELFILRKVSIFNYGDFFCVIERVEFSLFSFRNIDGWLSGY